MTFDERMTNFSSARAGLQAQIESLQRQCDEKANRYHAAAIIYAMFAEQRLGEAWFWFGEACENADRQAVAS